MKSAISSKRCAAQHSQTITIFQRCDLFFVAIILLSAYNVILRQRQYWSRDDDSACPAVSRNMTRNRFEGIKPFLHFADNDCLPQEDKMPKIRSLQKAVNASLQQFGVFAEDLSVDEHILGVIHVKYLFALKRFVLLIKTGYSRQAAIIH